MTKCTFEIVRNIRLLKSDSLQIVSWRDLCDALGVAYESTPLRLACAYLEGSGEIFIEHARENGTRETVVFLYQKFVNNWGSDNIPF